MNKLFASAVSYLLVPLLIFQYAVSGHDAYMYILGFICVAFFVLLGICMALMSKRKLVISKENRMTIRIRMRNQMISWFLHLVLGVIVAIAIFVYVNTFIGIVYSGSLVLLQLLRYRVRQAAFE